jgi:anti-sigma regulatory factor (Ser/Thr protein kinase)
MEPLPPVTVLDRASVSVVRERVREVARHAGLGTVDTEELALVASELAQNQLDHADAGTVAVDAIVRAGVPGVEIRAQDRGPGIPTPPESFLGAARPHGLGAGLPTVRRLAGELDIDIRYGEGSAIVVRRFAGPVPRHPELTVLGQGLRTPSGDAAFLRRDPAGLVVALIDGVGHGEAARRAADLAVQALDASGESDPTVLLAQIDAACRGSRGVAASVARWDVEGGVVSAAGMGNVSLRLFDPDADSAVFLPTPGVLGARTVRAFAARVVRAPPGAVLIAHTDGVETERELPRALLLQPPLFAAHHLLSRRSKVHDDRMVLVLR